MTWKHGARKLHKKLNRQRKRGAEEGILQCMWLDVALRFAFA